MIEKRRPTNLTEDEIEYYDLFDYLYAKYPKYSDFFTKGFIREMKTTRNRRERDIMTKCAGVYGLEDTLAENKHTVVAVSSSKSTGYAASDYVSNPYTFSEDFLIKLIDKQREYDKMVKESKEELYNIQRVYRGEKLKKALQEWREKHGSKI